MLLASSFLLWRTSDLGCFLLLVSINCLILKEWIWFHKKQNETLSLVLVWYVSIWVLEIRLTVLIFSNLVWNWRLILGFRLFIIMPIPSVQIHSHFLCPRTLNIYIHHDDKINFVFYLKPFLCRHFINNHYGILLIQKGTTIVHHHHYHHHQLQP